MGENDEKLSNQHLDEPSDREDAGGGDEESVRPTGGRPAADNARVGQHPAKMEERGTVDPDKPDPSGGPQ